MRVAVRTLAPALLFALPLLSSCSTGSTSARAATTANPVGEPSQNAGESSPHPGNGERDTVRPREPSRKETRTAAVIQQTFAAHRSGVRACFDVALKKTPGLRGNLTISFVLDPRGKVLQAHVNAARSTLNSAALSTCVVDAVMQISFPPSSRGMESRGNYPFNFNP